MGGPLVIEVITVMAEAQGTETENSAEKAYAAAAEAISDKTVVEAAPVEQAPEVAAAPAVEAKTEQQPAVEFPSKAKRAPKPAVTLPGLTDQDAGRFPVTQTVKAAAPAVEAPKPVVEAAAAPKAAAKPAKAVSVKPAPVKAAKIAKPIAAEPVKAAKAPVAAKVAPAKDVAAPVKAPAVKAEKPAAKTDKIVTAKKIPTVSLLKDKIMATKNAAKGKNFADNLKGRFADAQEKAKATFEKGSAAFGEYTEFTKGNFSAVVESGKIVAAGLQGIRTSTVADGRSALETLTADVKQLAALKKPADFVKLQRELTQRNFKQAVAFGSKNKDALTKLANEAIAPISGRVNLVVEKFKKAA